MKNIRLVDSKEIEIYDVTENGNTLAIQILNGDSSALEAVFMNVENLSVIQFYVGTDLVKGYANYQYLFNYKKQKSVTISIDYTKTDTTTKSGFKEETADILTMNLRKKTELEFIRDGQQLQDEAIMELASTLGR